MVQKVKRKSQGQRPEGGREKPARPSLEPAMLRIPQVGEVGGWSRATTYRLIASGHLEARKAGYLTLVPRASLDAYLAGLPAMRRAA